MSFGKVLVMIAWISRTTSPRRTGSRDVCPPRAKSSTCLTNSLPRLTLRSMLSMAFRLASFGPNRFSRVTPIQDRQEQVVEIVCDASRERAEALQPLRAEELLLELDAVGDVL